MFIQKKKDNSIKNENTVGTGFEHGRLKQTKNVRLSAGDLTDYPTSLFNVLEWNKRTVDIENNFINSEFIF